MFVLWGAHAGDIQVGGAVDRARSRALRRRPSSARLENISTKGWGW